MPFRPHHSRGSTQLPHPHPLVRQSFPLRRPAVFRPLRRRITHEASHRLCRPSLSYNRSLRSEGPPKSPPAKATATIGGHEITITYSSPGVKGREGKIFTADGLIKTSGGSQYPIWRGGANAATTLHTDADLMIGDLSVPKGDYTLFVDISDPDKWTLIVNKKTGEWGLAYDASQDLGKTKMTMSKPPSMVENLVYTTHRQRRWQRNPHAGLGRPLRLRAHHRAQVTTTRSKRPGRRFPTISALPLQ